MVYVLARRAPAPKGLRFRWWMPSMVWSVVAAGLLVYAATVSAGPRVVRGGHPRLVGDHHRVACAIPGDVAVPRGGTRRTGRILLAGPRTGVRGRLPAVYPTVCVQLPMFNEHAVARAAHRGGERDGHGRLTGSGSRCSTTPPTTTRGPSSPRSAPGSAPPTGRGLLGAHRVDRRGYKAGALEEGRQDTDAEFLVIFDADFLPPADFLLRDDPALLPPRRRARPGLALVQAQWGHLNHDESPLTRAQSLWVDDHHTLQMSWRSAAWRFVNFTGTAGVWRASAIEAAGGWRAASLVEDCELSFRHLFAGYRTKFVKEIVVPPSSRRRTPRTRPSSGAGPRAGCSCSACTSARCCSGSGARGCAELHLVYHMCISWQWPVWALWITMLPFADPHRPLVRLLRPGRGCRPLRAAHGAVGRRRRGAGIARDQAHLRRRLTPATFRARFARIVPVPRDQHRHASPPVQRRSPRACSARLHSEFERTPKAASVTTRSTAPGRRRRRRRTPSRSTGPTW